MVGPYEMRTIALLASGVGKTIWKVSLLTVLSEPKSNTATEGSPATESLYINAPRQVNVALGQLVFAKEMYAVGTELELLPEVGETEIVSVLPPCVYPPAVGSSPIVVYAVVAGPTLAAAVYKAILNVLGDVGPKL